MPYIFDSYKPERDQQFEVFEYSDGRVDLDAVVAGLDTSVRLEGSEVKELRDILSSLLDRTWGS